MGRNRKKVINRKEFLHRSTAGLIGIGVAGYPTSGFLQKISQEGTVQYRTLGRIGLKVTAVGLGGSRTDQPNVVKRVIDMGVNFIDTGRVYAKGRNEEMIGKVIKGVRSKIIIQSKFECEDDRRVIEKSIDGSLKALQTDCIDIMLRHGADTEEELTNDEVLESITKAKKSGKIRFCGFSTHRQAKMLRIAMKMGFYDIAMFPYNHRSGYWHQGGVEDKPFDTSGRFNEWDQDELEGVMKEAADSGLGLIAMKTCSGGPLQEDGESKATFTSALKWILRNKNISTIVPGMGNFREIDEDVRAMWG